MNEEKQNGRLGRPFCFSSKVRPHVGGGILRLLDRLGVYRQVDVITHKHAARFEGHVPGEAEVLAVQLGCSMEPYDLATPGRLALAVEGRVERNLAGHVAHCQVAINNVLVIALALDACTLEGSGWPLLCVKEI